MRVSFSYADRLLVRSVAVAVCSVAVLTAQSQPGRPAPAPAGGTAVVDGVAKVSGRVVDADTGRPLRRVRVRATPTRGTSDDYATSMLTDASGTFELEARFG